MAQRLHLALTVRAPTEMKTSTVTARSCLDSSGIRAHALTRLAPKPGTRKEASSVSKFRPA
jgi:hypothetical protein